MLIFPPYSAEALIIHNKLSTHSKRANVFYFFRTRKRSKNTHEEFPNILTTTDMFTCTDFMALDGLYGDQKAFLLQSQLAAAVLPFQSDSSAEVSMPHIFGEDGDKQHNPVG